MDENVNLDAIADNLSEKQREILRAYEDADVRNTRELTRETGYSNDTVGYHVKNGLIQKGLLEELDEKDHSKNAPNPPNQYRVTSLGREVIDLFRQREAKTEADISKVEELDKRVGRLESENDTIRERLDEAEAELEKHKEAIRYIRDELGLSGE